MESLFVMWRVTGKAHYREWAWLIFRAFQQHSRVGSGGYANLDSCLEVSCHNAKPETEVNVMLQRRMTGHFTNSLIELPACTCMKGRPNLKLDQC